MEPIQAALKSNQNIECYVGAIFRHGIRRLCVATEWRFFRPQTPRNAFLEMFVVHIKDIPFAVLCFDKRLVPAGAIEALLAEVQLKCPREGQLYVLGGRGTDAFPLSGPNVHFIEYVSGHWAYSNDRWQEDVKRREEDAAIEAEYVRPEIPDLPGIPEGAVSLTEQFQFQRR